MKLSDAEYAATLVARRLGLAVNASLTAPDHLVLMPSEIHENEGFSVEVHTSWRTADVYFLPGRFARPLIERMGEAGTEARMAFSALATAASKQGKLIFRVNGIDCDVLKPSSWPNQWQKLELVLRKQGVVFEELESNELKRLLEDMIAPIFGMCVALIGIEDIDADSSASEGEPVEAMSRRYERKPVNREICLSLRGSRCYCCNMDFGEVYGPAADGHIEVHHITPAAGMGAGYQINPVTELVPICCNCHSVLHITKPATNVDALKALFDKKQGRQ